MVYKKLLEFEEELNAASKKENSDDDSGYELDDSGMIPKLEELKAAGKNKTKEILKSDDVLADDDFHELDNDDYEDIYDFEVLDKYDEDNNDNKWVTSTELIESRNKNNMTESDDIDNNKIISREYSNPSDFDDITVDEKEFSNLKINFYNDDNNNSLNDDILEALQKIGDKTEIINAINKIADRDERLEVDNVDRFLDIFDKIANSLERVANSLDKIANKFGEE